MKSLNEKQNFSTVENTRLNETYKGKENICRDNKNTIKTQPDTANEIKQEVCEYCGTPKTKKELAFANSVKVFWIANCDCADKILAEKEQRKKNFERYKALKKQYKQAGFTRRQLGHRLRNLTCEHKQKFIDWVENFRPRKSKGMYLYGGVGNGKTTSASSIAKELVNKGYKKIYFFTMAEYLNKMQQTYNSRSSVSFDELMQKWFDADAIFIDDFGREKYSEKRLENVFLFFDGLYSNCTTFFVISNPENMLRIKEIPEFEAIWDRFSEVLEKVVFKGRSMRKLKGEKNND